MTNAKKTYPGVANLIGGSMMAFPSIVAFYLVCIEDLDTRETVFNKFRDEYERAMEQMLEETRGLFENVAARKRNALDADAAPASV